MYSRSVFLLSFVSTCLTCGGAFAQMTPNGNWRDLRSVWPAPDNVRRDYGIRADPGIQTQSELNKVRQRPSSGDVITLHELAHKIPGRARKEFESGTKAQKKGDEQSAIEHLKKAVAIDPEYLVARNNLGVSLLRTNRTDLAIEQFNRAIAIDPHGAMPYCNLAVAFMVQNKLADAERAARQTLKLNGEGTRGRLILGLSLVLQKKFTPEAEQNLIIATAHFPQANLLLAPVLAAKGETEHARERLKTYLASGDKSGIDIANDWLRQLNSGRPSR